MPDSMSPRTIQADLTWIDGAFVPDQVIAVGADGRIESVGPARAGADHRLEGVALLPGFVNAHSHAFQRGLRGSGERFASGAGSFWSWREGMYALGASLHSEGFRRLRRQAF